MGLKLGETEEAQLWRGFPVLALFESLLFVERLRRTRRLAGCENDTLLFFEWEYLLYRQDERVPAIGLNQPLGQRWALDENGEQVPAAHLLWVLDFAQMGDAWEFPDL